jgi:tRNA1Val (adenine37-N6)-methyltransferase
MGAPFFRFKQFTVWHDQCAMKVGTDGVLLGAWCPLPSRANECVRVLDIGTGSGLIALMIAQRLYVNHQDFSVIGIDIDAEAAQQSRINFERSPWSKHLQSEGCGLQNFNKDNTFDLIVSNPPYFQNSLKNPNNARAAARHTDNLSYKELIFHASQMLTEHGILALVLPAEAEKEIIALGAEHHLQHTHISYVHPKPGKEVKRILIAFTKSKDTLFEPFSTHFYIESNDSPRSEEYKAMTKEFYL